MTWTIVSWIDTWNSAELLSFFCSLTLE